jgi:hypothetical protein
MDEARVLMDYWRNDAVLVSSDVYTQEEKEHLYDVKKIVHNLFYITIFLSFWLLAASLWLYRR